MLSKLKEQVNNASNQVSTSVKQAQESNVAMSKQINQANQTMKLASLVNKDAEKLSQGVSQAQRSLVPLIDKVNDTLAQGDEMIDQSKKEIIKQIDKGNDYVEQKKNQINQIVQEQKQEFEKQYYGETPTDDGNNDNIKIEKSNCKQQIAKQIPQDQDVCLQNQEFKNYQQLQINQRAPQTTEEQQDQLQDSTPNDTQQSNKNVDYSRTTLGNEEENKHNKKSRRQEIQNKIKSYMKKITGKQVNSRIEYLCLLSSKMRNNDDNQLLFQSRNLLKDNIWQCAQQERRILSHQNLYEYMSKVLEFMFEYLTIIETVFQQLKMRFKSSNRSFHILDNYLSGVITQLEYYETYSYVKCMIKILILLENESILSLMFTRKAREFQKEKKKPNDLQIEVQNQVFHPKLCETFSTMEDQFKHQLIGINSIKQIIRSEYKEKLQQCYQENKQKLEDYFVQVQGQRNITFQIIEEFYQSFQKYDQVYEQNSRAIINQTQITRDLYDEEYKTLHTFRYLIKQQQQFGIFTTYLLTELQALEEKRITVIKDVLTELSKKCSQYFVCYKGFEQQFQDPLILQQSKTAFDISNLVSQDQLNIIKKYAVLKQDTIVTHEIYSAFATNFKIPEPISTLESHPLIIKQYNIMRDVAWERSLSFGKDLIPCQCVVTVDGFILFYDSDIHCQGQEYAQYSNYQLPIKDLIMKPMKDDSLLQLIVTNKGKIFDTHKKQIIKFEEQLTQESLEIVINQFK